MHGLTVSSGLSIPPAREILLVRDLRPDFKGVAKRWAGRMAVSETFEARL
jgi:hypothetical protein